ncbi:NAD(P)-binding domain-containing protein [Amycolatopsis sp. NEAU-NG30]|uniref:NAD(P)-binding domain-containing protein n=1 Tax=Amycolatopsis melonis TaxID=3156488 RepID=A0ABV0LHP6_9PSEU
MKRIGEGEQPEVFLSPRSARTAAELAERHENVRVCESNQAVVDRSDLVIIAVRRHGYREALEGLRVDAGKIVVNVMAGVGHDELRATLGTEAPLVRAIPRSSHGWAECSRSRTRRPSPSSPR